MAKTSATLIQLPPDKIKRNPANPRIIFREQEMQELLDSIDEVGIRVPIIVYEERQRYILIDGERRWRCATKLNLRAMPAIVHPKPTKLENLLMMFNIHNVRVAWDLLPMAFKLREIRDLIAKQGQATNYKHLSAITGLSAATVKRAFELLDLPMKYQNLLLEEAKKPKEKQEVTADLFVEIIKSRNVIERYIPEVFDEVTPRKYLDAMVAKYRAKIIPSVTAFRSVSKIARAERAGESPQEAAPVIVQLVTDPQFTIDEAYEQTVKRAYQYRDLTTQADKLASEIHRYRSIRRMPEPLRESLRKLRAELNRLFGRE